jgi:signal transduction histidine kinase
LDRLSKLTGDLIDVSRSRTGKLRLQLERIDINQLVASVVSDSRLIDDSHPISIEGQISRRAKIDSVRIRQVLVNLLNNAKTYSPPNSEIIVSVVQANPDLIIKVIDYGRGIARPEQDKIFEAFYQKEGTKKAQTGFGLGLYISKQIITLHGGKIWVDSQAGKGSTFAFSVPINGPSKAGK